VEIFRSFSFMAFVVLLVSPSLARADAPRPRVLFVVDTTGSMNASLVDGAPLGGDGSEMYPGDHDIAGTPHVDCAGYGNLLVPGSNCSRLLQIKNALADALSASPPGTGLMRFTQFEAQSQMDLLSFDTGFYDSLNNYTEMTNFDGVGCGSYDFSDLSFWLTSRGSSEAHEYGGDLLVEVPVSDPLDTRNHVRWWFDHLERWWAGGDPGNPDFVTWSEVVTLDDGGYLLSSFTNKELRSVSNSSVTVSTLHEAWTYMSWLRNQDPLGEVRRYLIFAVIDGIDACGHDVTELDVYWDLKAPSLVCQERFAFDECPAIELYPIWFPDSSDVQVQEITNVAWSGTTAGSALSQGRYFSDPLAPEIVTWIRMILLDADGAQIFSDGFEIGDATRWSLMSR